MVSRRRPPTSAPSVPEAPDADAHAPVHALLALMTPSPKPELVNEVAVRTVVSKKRNVSSSEDDGKRSSSTEDAAPRKPRVRKYRKATHTIRKVRDCLPRSLCAVRSHGLTCLYVVRAQEEKELLLDQLAQLQSSMNQLREKTLTPCAHECHGCDSIERSNDALREAVQQQQLVLASAHAMFSEYTRLQPQCPMERFIHLGRDPAARQATLQRMREAKIDDAHRFLQSRFHRLDPTRVFMDRQQFDTPEGDVCTVRCVIMKMEGVRSVKQAYDVILFQMWNLEISISERVGSITIREDDDDGLEEHQHIRLVSSTPWNVQVESNGVTFSDYKECDEIYGGGHECAIVTSDFVDVDDLYPYRPAERVRRDTCAIVKLTSHKTGPGENDTEVVVTRWVQTVAHYPQFPISADVWQDTVMHMERWADAIQSSISEMLKAQASSSSS